MHQARAGFSCGKETAEPSTPPRIMVSGLKANAHTTDLSPFCLCSIICCEGMRRGWIGKRCECYFQISRKHMTSPSKQISQNHVNIFCCHRKIIFCSSLSMISYSFQVHLFFCFCFVTYSSLNSFLNQFKDSIFESWLYRKFISLKMSLNFSFRE